MKWKVTLKFRGKGGSAIYEGKSASDVRRTVLYELGFPNDTDNEIELEVVKA